MDKSLVHGARLHQTHSLSEPTGEPTLASSDTAADVEEDPGHPPHPFTSGDSLLAATHKHNVIFPLFSSSEANRNVD